jgi:hypothetical protein
VVRLESPVQLQFEELHVNGGQPVVRKNERAEVDVVHLHHVEVVISCLVKEVWLRSRTVVSEGRKGKAVRFLPEQSTLTV